MASIQLSTVEQVYAELCEKFNDSKAPTFEQILPLLLKLQQDPVFCAPQSWISNVTRSLAMLCPLPSGELPDIENTLTLMFQSMAHGLIEAQATETPITTVDLVFLDDIGKAISLRLPPILSTRTEDLFLKSLANDLAKALPIINSRGTWWSIRPMPGTDELSLVVDVPLKAQQAADPDSEVEFKKAKPIRFSQLSPKRP